MREALSEETIATKPTGEYPVGDAEAARTRDSLEGQVVCPFCGAISDGSQAICGKCTMENSAVARKATKLRIGPWYVLQHRNPAAPGMKWETLLTFVRKGRVKPQSIVRGPTTHQLWRFAAHVKGLSREFGVCYSCGGSVERNANLCTHCNRLQEPPVHPDTLLEGVGGGEVEAKLPIYKEITPQQPGDGQIPLEHAAEDEEVRKLREEAEAFAREQRETIARERETLEQDKQSAIRDREVLRREREAITREREASVREREAAARAKDDLEKERLALAQDMENLRRDREALLNEPGPVRDTAADVAPATPAPAVSQTAPPSPAREPVVDKSVWDLGDHEHHDAPVTGATTPPPPPSSPTSPSTERPVGIRGASPPKRPLARDTFLSAKDLAAAFRLNIQPEIDYNLAVQPNEAALVGANMPQQQAPPNYGLRFLLVLFFAGVIAMIVLFASQPSWRERAMRMWNDLTEPAPAKLPRQRPIPTVPDEPGDLSNSDFTNQVPASIPATRPATRPANSGTSEISDVKRVLATQPIVTHDQVEQAQILYKEAEAAEIRHDFDQAARLFDLIQQLPRSVWPKEDVEDRAKINRIQSQSKQ